MNGKGKTAPIAEPVGHTAKSADPPNLPPNAHQATICGDCGHELIPKKPGAGGGDLWEQHECDLGDVLDYAHRYDDYA